MARHAFVVVAVAALAFAQIALAQETQDAQATPEHKGGKRYPDHSYYNPSHGYSPIGSDKSNVYYRIRVDLNIVEYYRSSPLLPNLALTHASALGTVTDTTTNGNGVQVGTFDSLTTQLNNPTAPGASTQLISIYNIALGDADHAGSVVASGAWTVNTSVLQVIDSDLAITGGTGHFTGAKGNLYLETGSLGDRLIHAVLVFAVPYNMPL